MKWKHLLALIVSRYIKTGEYSAATGVKRISAKSSPVQKLMIASE